MKKPIIIAECCQNHNGDFNILKDMVHSAAEIGADYVKIQKRNPDICVPENEKNKFKSTPWGDMTYLTTQA